MTDRVKLLLALAVLIAVYTILALMPSERKLCAPDSHPDECYTLL